MFRQYVSENFDNDDDGTLSEEEIGGVMSIYVGWIGISSLTGIEYFTALTFLDCNGNQLTALDVSNNVALISLTCSVNQLTSLDLSKNTVLTYLECAGNQLTSLDVSKNVALTYLDCSDNRLTALDLSSNIALETLHFASNQLSEIDLSHNTELKKLAFYGNQLKTLDVTHNTMLGWISCSGNQLVSIDVSGNPDLTYLDCYGNQLTTLDVSKNVELTTLYCFINQLTTLDLSNNTALTSLNCTNNQLTTLDLSNCPVMYELSYDEGVNVIGARVMPSITTWTLPRAHIGQPYSFQLELAGTEPITTTCSGDMPSGLTLSETGLISGTASETGYFTIYVIASNDYGGNEGWLELEVVEPAVMVVSIDAEHFPDEAFRQYVIESCDTDKDGNLSNEEIAEKTQMYVSWRGIQTLKGVEYFTALTYLDCSGNELTELDMSNNTALTSLNCWDNQLTSLDMSKNVSLDALYCSLNQLTKLDVSNNTALLSLSCGYNQLTELDVSQNTALQYLECDGNQFTELNVSNNAELTTLSCSDNHLTELDVSKNTALVSLSCGNNQLTSLDVSNNVELTTLNCYGNRLTELDVSQNTALQYLSCDGNQLTELDVSNNVALGYLDCNTNQLTALDVSSNTALTSLNCWDNQLTELDIRNCPSLTLDSLTADSNVLIIRPDADGLPSFGKHSLLLSGQLGADFYLNVPEGIDTSGSYVTFTASGKTSNPAMFSNVASKDILSNDTYRFTSYINSVQMADEIQALYVYSEDSRSLAAAQEFTVKDYLDTIIASTDLQAKSPDLVHWPVPSRITGTTYRFRSLTSTAGKSARNTRRWITLMLPKRLTLTARTLGRNSRNTPSAGTRLKASPQASQACSMTLSLTRRQQST